MSIRKAVAANPYREPNVFNPAAAPVAGTGVLPPGSAPAAASATVSWAVPAMLAGAGSTKAVAIPGVQPGDPIDIAFATPMPQDVAVLAAILAAGTVTLQAVNNGTTTNATATVAVTVQVRSAGMVAAEQSVGLRGE